MKKKTTYKWEHGLSVDTSLRYLIKKKRISKIQMEMTKEMKKVNSDEQIKI